MLFSVYQLKYFLIKHQVPELSTQEQSTMIKEFLRQFLTVLRLIAVGSDYLKLQLVQAGKIIFFI